MKSYFLTSESVSEGHPDKVADQISDAILDALLLQDKYSRVACEVYIKTGIIIVGGEITTTANIDIDQIIRTTVKNIGYIHLDIGFDANTCAILNVIGKQSYDIHLGITRKHLSKQGAGDQGIMYGYATSETNIFMPAPIVYAHKLVYRQAQLRKNGCLPWLRPDAKSQLTFQYKNNKIYGIDTVVFSTQHSESITYDLLKEAVMEEIIKPILPHKWLNKNTKYYINTTGRFVIGGPVGDCGLTGRKIMVDTYGGIVKHGGGSFSGKDPTKVDRSGAYMARYVAKNIVAAGLAKKCEIQLSYAMGIAEPISLVINTFGTEKISLKRLYNTVKNNFDFRPGLIIHELDLLRPIYLQTSSYGHFGRSIFSWEKLNKISLLKEI